MVYRIRIQPDEYQCVWYKPEDEGLIDRLKTGDFASRDWRSPDLILGDSSQISLKLPDFPALSPHLLVASTVAWDTIRPVVADCVEALPAKLPNKIDCKILNITRVIDSLLLERCETNKLPDDQSGYFSKIHKYEFDKIAIANAHLFKCPEMKAFEIYASDEFRNVVLQNGFTGIKFVKIF